MTQQTDRDVLYDLVQAIRVAPFISADEALRRCREAAEEIERLAALAQSDAGAIDRARHRIGVVIDTLEAGGEPVNWERNCIRFLHEALEALAIPPRPDASAGLIEAAEIVNDWANATSSLIEARLFDALAQELRARAADRSGK